MYYHKEVFKSEFVALKRVAIELNVGSGCKPRCCKVRSVLFELKEWIK